MTGGVVWDEALLTKKEHALRARVDGRVPVYFVHNPDSLHMPLALGMLYAHIEGHDGGALLEHYIPLPIWDFTGRRVERMAHRFGAGVWLFSNYTWSVDQNMAVSRAVKWGSRDNVTIHGGPSAPKYPEACAQFLRAERHVDFVVRGEGEATIIELLQRLVDVRTSTDWSSLGDVRGLTIAPGRTGGAVVRTDDRPRDKVLAFPSPYLEGCFDDYCAPIIAATIESNRGCPYGCTFCDWGSAILQKIRKFDLDRVKAEIEWIAKRGVNLLWIADANFGVFDRDVEIAEHVVAMKEEWGYPREVVVNYAKNATKRLAAIVAVFSRAGICSEGLISLQTTDPATLSAVDRSNIKTERYDELVEIFRAENLPLMTDLMIGLPGATVATFQDDLQRCFDKRVAIKVFRTKLLPNSPMADPAYMDDHAIVVDDQQHLVSTRTYSEDDMREMLFINRYYRLLVQSAMVRYVLHHVQWAHGIRAIDVITHIARLARDNAADIPHLATLQIEEAYGRIPARSALYAEVRRVLSEAYDIDNSPALDVAFLVNQHLMPELQRSFPEPVELPFDFVTYFFDRAEGRLAKPLEAYPPGNLVVTDPDRLCEQLFEDGQVYDSYRIQWELHSALAGAAAPTNILRASDAKPPSLPIIQ